MHQDMILAGVGAMLIVVLLRVFRTWQKDPTRKPAAAKRPRVATAEPYHSVSLTGDCECLKSYRGKRFLARHAPPLPVPDCPVLRCHCHYVHHADRRKPAGDRRSVGRMSGERLNFSGDEERRHSRGRRKSDSSWAATDPWSNTV